MDDDNSEADRRVRKRKRRAALLIIAVIYIGVVTVADSFVTERLAGGNYQLGRIVGVVVPIAALVLLVLVLGLVRLVSVWRFGKRD